MTLTLHALALLAALHLAPKHDLDHLDRVTGDIALAVELGDHPFEGSARDEAAVLALVVIAHHEGGFLESVETCARTGDGGRSVTLFQLMSGVSWYGNTRRELCSNGALAALSALRVLYEYGKNCRYKSPGATFRAYASGSCSAQSDAARDMCRTWETIAAAIGLNGASCRKNTPITWATGLPLVPGAVAGSR